MGGTAGRYADGQNRLGHFPEPEETADQRTGLSVYVFRRRSRPADAGRISKRLPGQSPPDVRLAKPEIQTLTGGTGHF